MGMDYGIQIHQQYIYDGLLTIRDDKNCTLKTLIRLPQLRLGERGWIISMLWLKTNFLPFHNPIPKHTL